MSPPRIAELLRSLQAVIFDVDGTLVDSNDAHTTAWQRALAEHGHEVQYAVIRKWIGMGGDELLPAVAGIAIDGELGRAIAERRREIFEKSLPELRATPGARELFLSLERHGIRRAVASPAKAYEVDALLAIAGVSGFVETKVTASEVREAPDVVEEAMAELAVAPGRVALVGDSPYDVEAAERAGIVMIAVRTGGYGDRELQRAVVIYDDCRALRRAFEGAFGRSGATAR